MVGRKDIKRRGTEGPILPHDQPSLPDLLLQHRHILGSVVFSGVSSVKSLALHSSSLPAFPSLYSGKTLDISKNLGSKGALGTSLVVQWLRNPPANAGDTGSSPGPERSHMLQSN